MGRCFDFPFLHILLDSTCIGHLRHNQIDSIHIAVLYEESVKYSNKQAKLSLAEGGKHIHCKDTHTLREMDTDIHSGNFSDSLDKDNLWVYTLFIQQESS